MAKNVIFLVHGVGVHPAGWSNADDGPIKALSDAAEYYPGFSEQDPLSAAVEFVEIRYDDIFDDIRTRWAELAQSLNGKGLGIATPPILDSITEVLAQADGDSVIATHVLDVGMYVGFRLVQRLVQLRVASEMMKTIADHAAEDEGSRHYSVIAHSLGTTVAHDSIQRMATAGWLSDAEKLSGALADGGFTTDDLQRVVKRYGKNPFAPSNFKFDCLFQIANTSRLLSQTKPAYDSSVRPRFSSGPRNNAVHRFFNVDHVLDPIGKFRKHRAKEAWPRAASKATAMDLFDIDHIHDINVHGFAHYLFHPALHSRILTAAAPTRFKFPDFQTARARVADGGDFPRFAGKYVDDDLQDNVEAVLSTLSPNTLDKLPEWIEPKVRDYLGGIQISGTVMGWLKAVVGLNAALEELKESLS